MVSLLDVNVLVALFDTTHLHHEAAHVWFAVNRQQNWATCPLTENAFVRVVSNPSYPGLRTTPEDAARLLRDLCLSADHLFWADSLSICDFQRFRWRHIQGHRQLTDVYLLALSVANEGRFVTFDGSVSIRSVEDAEPRNLEIIAV